MASAPPQSLKDSGVKRDEGIAVPGNPAGTICVDVRYLKYFNSPFFVLFTWKEVIGLLLAAPTV